MTEPTETDRLLARFVDEFEHLLEGCLNNKGYDFDMSLYLKAGIFVSRLNDFMFDTSTLYSINEARKGMHK
jgi:hypothetical protein